MMHPTDTANQRDQDDIPASSEIRAGWWAVLALVIIVALLVTAVIAFSGDASAPQQPQPTEAPVDPGA